MKRKKVKPIRKKKTLTAAQKEAQRIRLEKMRAKKKPPEYKNVNKYVLSLDDEEPYSLKNVKAWIKHNKEMISMLQAIANNDIVPFTRVPWNEPGIIMKMLDLGVMGVIAPMINTKKECEDFVSYCNYPPRGQ